MKSNFIIIAHPRSGSTFVCRLFDKFSRINVFLEIFHTNKDVIKSHLKGHFPAIVQRLGNSSDIEKNIRKAFIGNCKEYLNAIGEMTQQDRFIYKVFPGHLPKNRLSNVINEADLVIILSRNLLHSYLSDNIATRLQKWSGVNTSKELTIFKPEDFIGHVERVLNFYDSAVKFSEGHQVRVVKVNYEEAVSCSNPLEFMTCFEPQIDLGELSIDYSPDDKRQDQRKLASEKVVNHDEMLRFLESVGLLTLDEVTNYCETRKYRRAIERYRFTTKPIDHSIC